MTARWALITGASSGLGAEFARLAAAEGWNLVLAARSQDKLEALAGALTAAHRVEAVAMPADLARPGAAGALWQAASDGREIGALVNNAGLGRYGDFGDGNTAGWAREAQSISVNVSALAELLHLAVADMRARGQGGKILNVASTAGFMPGPNMAVYHATKAFALHLSEAVATELAGSGITVTALCPGVTGTRFFDDVEVERTWLMALFPVGRPERVAQAGWRAMQAGQRVKITGVMNTLLANSPRLAPRRMLAATAGKLLSRKM